MSLLRGLEKWGLIRRRPWDYLDRALPFQYPAFLDLEGADSFVRSYLDESLFLGDWLEMRGLSIPSLGEKLTKTEGGYVLSVPMPGMEEEDISVSLEGKVLKVKAKRSIEGQEEGYVIYDSGRRETAEYDIELSLSSGIRESDVEPVYKNGILTVTVKSPEEVLEEPKEVKIPVKQA